MIINEDVEISKDPRTQEILFKAANFMEEIAKEDRRKILEVEKVFHKRFAFLPTKLSSGKWIFLKKYHVRYRAKHVGYWKITQGGLGVTITNIRKHYIDKDFVPNLKRPIEKV